MSRAVDREEILSGGFASTTNSLLRVAGGWGNIGGPGMFMIRSITSGVLTSIFVGMTGASISAMFYQTAGLPFIVCSCIGFMLGTIGFYKDSIRKSFLYLERYPRLLQLHLDANFPSQRFDLWPRSRLTSASFQTWPLKSMLVVGWLTAMPAIENIMEGEEQKMVSEQTDPPQDVDEVKEAD